MSPLRLSPDDYDNPIAVPIEGVVDESEKSFQNLPYYETLVSKKQVQNMLISPRAIRNRVKKMAKLIGSEYEQGTTIHAVMVLTGAFMFASDLIREIFSQTGRDLILHLVKTSTYRKEIKHYGEKERMVKFQLDIDHLEGKKILVIEDLVDQGFTLNTLVSHLRNKKGAASVKTCVLMRKNLKNPSSQVQEIKRKISIDYEGFFVPDVWIAGYGIDAANEYRHLPYIILVNEQSFK